MDLAARKYKLMEQFMQIASADKLEKLEKFFKKEILEDKDVWDELPVVVQQIVMQSKEESKKGEVTPHSEVMEKIKAKYKVA